ncbi:MAG: AraC family transcriptional regulator [Lachnospiraceae bacterium]|nr:AraC family transcriptional regulator [Lachnospiraceae bacterium]
MTPDRTTYDTNNSLPPDNVPIIQNTTNSHVHRFYRMDKPFCITLEFCSGSEEDSYVNTVTLSPQKSLMGYQTLAAKNWFYTMSIPHFHNYYEFVIVLEGTITLYLEGTPYLLPSGSCCLLNCGLCHLEKYASRCMVLFIGLSVPFMEKLMHTSENSLFPCEKNFCDTDIYRFIQEYLSHPAEKVCLKYTPVDQNESCKKQLRDLTESMMQTLFNPIFGTSHLIIGQFCSFMDYLSSDQNYHCTRIRISNSSDFFLFFQITTLLEENDGRMSRADLELQLNYSDTHLNRVVKKYTGICLSDYSMSFRLERAAKYLIETSESVQSVAEKLQFTNRTHFYKLFKKKYGVTPKEYREMVSSPK